MGVGFAALAARRAAAAGVSWIRCRQQRCGGKPDSRVRRCGAVWTICAQQAHQWGKAWLGTARWRSSRCCRSTTENLFWSNGFRTVSNATAVMIGPGLPACRRPPRRSRGCIRHRPGSCGHDVAAALAEPGCRREPGHGDRHGTGTCSASLPEPSGYASTWERRRQRNVTAKCVADSHGGVTLAECPHRVILCQTLSS